MALPCRSAQVVMSTIHSAVASVCRCCRTCSHAQVTKQISQLYSGFAISSRFLNCLIKTHANLQFKLALSVFGQLQYAKHETTSKTKCSQTDEKLASLPAFMCYQVTLADKLSWEISGTIHLVIMHLHYTSSCHHAHPATMHMTHLKVWGGSKVLLGRLPIVPKEHNAASL